jgi:flagellar protein FlaG
MGFSLTGTHVVFFIASVVVASAVSGVFIGIISGVTTSLQNRGERVEENLDIEFKIINDPNNIPDDGTDYLFYLKNIGERKIPTTNDTFTLFIDGELVERDNYNFSDNSIQKEEYTILYIDISEISAGDQVIRIVGPQDIVDEMTFTI